MEDEIIKLLKEKASTKQLVYRLTQSVFSDFQKTLKQKAARIYKAVTSEDKNIEIAYSSKVKFEAQIIMIIIII